MLTLLSLTTFVHPPKFHTSPLKKWPFFKRKGVFQSSNHHFSTSFVNFQGGRMTIQGKCRGQCEPQIFQKVYPSWGAMMQWHKLIEHVPLGLHMGVSKNRGTPKSSILIGFFSVNHPFWGTPIFGNTHIWVIKNEHLIFKRGSQLTECLDDVHVWDGKRGGFLVAENLHPGGWKMMIGRRSLWKRGRT